jgi:hypothetical protein
MAAQTSAILNEMFIRHVENTYIARIIKIT